MVRSSASAAAPAPASPPAPPPAPIGAPATAAWQVLGDRLARWESDGTLDRLLGLAEGMVGVTEAVTDRMLASAGTTLIGSLSLLDWIAQDERRREVVMYLIERLAEWKETGALDTLVSLAEGMAGVAQATTDEMVGHAGATAIGWVQFVESLPPKERIEPLVHAAVRAAPVLGMLAESTEVLGDPAAREQALQGIPKVSGVFALGRALRDPETQRGLQTLLLLMKQLGRSAAAAPPR